MLKSTALPIVSIHLVVIVVLGLIAIVTHPLSESALYWVTGVAIASGFVAALIGSKR